MDRRAETEVRRDLVPCPPSGETFTCAAPGRADRVPLMLAKALDEAQAEADK